MAVVHAKLKPNHLIRRVFPTSRRLLVKESLSSLAARSWKDVLVIGAGHDPYQRHVRNTGLYVRTDIKTCIGATDVVGDALKLPFQRDSFDCLVATEVLEHLRNPFHFADEALRVLRNGGSVIVTVPFMFHQHSDPFDFWRPTEQGLREIFRSFDYVIVRPQGNRVHVISDILTTSFYPKSIFVPLRVLNRLFVLFASERKRRFTSCPSGFFVEARK